MLIVRPLQVAHQRQSWPSQDLPGQNQSGPDQPDGGLAPLDGSTQARLRQRRWREPRHERRQLWLALVVAVLLHALFVVAIWYGMRPRPAILVASPPEAALQIRFIARSPTVVAELPPAQALPSPPKPPVRPRPQPVAKDAMTLQLPTPKPAMTARLYDEQGQPLLPAAAASAPVPGYVQRLPQGDSRIMQHTSPIKYQATRFDDGWVKRTSTVDQALQNLVDKTTIKKTIDLPRGVRIHCAISIAMLQGSCGGDPPAPPSAKDGDERLSMAPAKSLDGEAHAAKSPSVETCIAMYRAGKPLAWGCPVDTPNRSVDAELHERAASAARAH